MINVPLSFVSNFTLSLCLCYSTLKTLDFYTLFCRSYSMEYLLCNLMWNKKCSYQVRNVAFYFISKLAFCLCLCHNSVYERYDVFAYECKCLRHIKTLLGCK